MYWIKVLQALSHERETGHLQQQVQEKLQEIYKEYFQTQKELFAQFPPEVQRSLAAAIAAADGKVALRGVDQATRSVKEFISVRFPYLSRLLGMKSSKNST